MNKKSQVILIVLLFSMSGILAGKMFKKNESLNALAINNEQNKPGSDNLIEANFKNLCKEIILKSGVFVEAKCNNKSVSIDLSKCLANFNGKLVYTKNGSFDKSCNNCAIKEIKDLKGEKSWVLECSCADSNKRQNLITKIDLSDFLYVKSGALLCDNMENIVEAEEVISPSIIDTNCDKVALASNTRFTASCTNANSPNSANRVNVDFNLNICISNQNGKLASGVNGNFGGSCRNCKIVQKNKIYLLACECADVANAFKSVESPLNKFITFRGNSIRCVSSDDDDNTAINVKPASNTSVNVPKAPVIVERLKQNKNLSAADNFMILCRNIRIENVNFLIAVCGENKIEYTLNLNSCFSNMDGSIKIAKDGGYGRSCRKCELKFDLEYQYVLECNCQRADQIRWIDTNISLRERIVYNESKNALECLTDVVLPEDKSNKLCTKS